MNPDNVFPINDKATDNDTFKEIIEEIQEPELNWNKIAPLIRHEDDGSPIIMDNVNEIVVDEVNTNVLGVLPQNGPSTSNLSVLTSYFDHNAQQWLKTKRATHPFISVEMTKINPRNNNRSDSKTTTQCVMTDSGAMCSLLNFKMVEDMGLNP